ncbi:PilN domain-containing protein [Massilia niastensis]|uniref:PilN domain-containing protein n=1 Tax=Massilia niastensis TaxID=544911 RepID=UPI0003650F6A|nr:PilN domain-containing protein [Massilia niastensis]
MRRTRIDFAPRSLRRTLFMTPPRLLGLWLAAAGVCVPAVFQGMHYLEQQREVEALRAALAARVAAPAPTRVAVRRPPVPEAQANAVNDIVMQLNLPWRDLAEAVRDATPASVALLALEPDAKRRTLRISAEARTSDDMFAYVARMQAQDWFSSVVLTRHEVVEQDPNRPLRFQVSAQWGGQ